MALPATPRAAATKTPTVTGLAIAAPPHSTERLQIIGGGAQPQAVITILDNPEGYNFLGIEMATITSAPAVALLCERVELLTPSE
jgi:hypothetical protein